MLDVERSYGCKALILENVVAKLVRIERKGIESLYWHGASFSDKLSEASSCFRNFATCGTERLDGDSKHLSIWLRNRPANTSWRVA